MIKVDQWTTIRTLYNEGYGKKRIAKILGISVNTVRRALKDDTPPSYRRTKTTEQKILPYLEQVREMYLEKKLIGTRIFEELKKLGYDGSLMTLYRCLRMLKEEPGNRASLRFETLPGEQAQFDWSPFDVEIAGEKVRVYCFLVILGYSRMKYMTFNLKQDLFAVIEALEEAFWFFGGSSKELLVDNAKQIVFEIRNGVKCFNETFLALAGLYRFRPVAKRRGTPRPKGRWSGPSTTSRSTSSRGTPLTP
ncbi:MAG: IS21 family transposase [Firmicutes bacterium]|nr:IS21 family transposase [Bacillota bacterium]